MDLLLDIAFLTILGFISIEDLKTMEISDKWHLAIIALGVVRIFLCNGSLNSNIYGMLVVFLPLLGLALLCPGAIGGGDIKMISASGFYLGCGEIVKGCGAGFLLGGIYGTWLLLSGKKKGRDCFPFGPWLALGIAGAAMGII